MAESRQEQLIYIPPEGTSRPAKLKLNPCLRPDWRHSLKGASTLDPWDRVFLRHRSTRYYEHLEGHSIGLGCRDTVNVTKRQGSQAAQSRLGQTKATKATETLLSSKSLKSLRAMESMIQRAPWNRRSTSLAPQDNQLYDL